MRRKFLFFGLFGLFFLVSSISTIKVQGYTGEETTLVNDKNCWGWINGVFQYNENLLNGDCKIKTTELNTTILHPEYCKVLKDSEGRYIQRVKTWQSNADIPEESGYVDKYANTISLGEVNPLGEVNSYYLTCGNCREDVTYGGRLCDYIEVEGLEERAKSVCPSRGSITWYLVDNDDSSEERTWNGKFTQDNEEVCVSENGPVVICNLSSKSWEDKGNSGCSDGKKCFNVKKNNENGLMQTECKEDLKRTDTCTDDREYVLQANDYGYKKVKAKDYFAERGEMGCEKCGTENGKLVCQTSEDQIIGDCRKIKGGLVNGSEAGKSICHNNQIYTCETSKKPEYTPGEKCEGSTPKCLDNYGDPGNAKCVSEAEYNKYDHSQIEIMVGSDSNFFCDNDNGIETALGCIPYSMSGLAERLLPLLFGVAGGISFLLMVYGFILMATSSGDEKKLLEARSRITSAVTGLLVSIFAIFLFRLIFSNILKIPGL